MRRHGRNLNGIFAGAGIPLLLAAMIGTAKAEEAVEVPSKKIPLVVETLATGLEQPWSVEVLPDGSSIISEKQGTLRIVKDGKVSAPIAGVPPVSTEGQGGLLDIALAPDFATSRTLYFTYSALGEGGAGTALAKARLSQDDTRLEDETRLFLMSRLTTRGQHFGSRIAIAKDGSLFFGIGDRGEETRAQDPRDHAGAILHINPDGTPHADNPFVGTANGLPEIWSKGHRNPQGLTIDAKDGTLLTAEHGARGGDEVNTPQPAATTAGRVFPTAATIPARNSSSARRPKVSSSRSIIGIRPSHPAPSPSIMARCSRNGRATCWSPR